MFEKLKNDPERFEKFFHYLAYRYLRDQGKCVTEKACKIVMPSDVDQFLKEIDNYIDNDEGFNKSYLNNLEKKDDKKEEDTKVSEGV